MKKGWYIDIAPIITANREASSGNIWTVPVGGGLGRLMKIGFQPMNMAAEFYGKALRPSGASPWGMRIQLALLFPKLTKKEEERKRADDGRNAEGDGKRAASEIIPSGSTSLEIHPVFLD